ncbi:hypothetical protein Celal_2343 [Cellulophaga algicola DSM 14237]|uniref:Lipoprotein n=1 Tax=Cellulophaga algicola (strain DSM 14237 / IC166 / ACAM 630) TaxID=688270 RepID=E6X7F2_CELAD|nr:hypothetical protein [Cellulophaga algicola]ADV49634.1 hypothetical protein Celal_2343 [Cellulophaga algicola DSM 14237]
MKKIYLITSMILALAFTSCDDDDDNQELQVIPAAGSIAGGPFTFCVDGTADMVSGITIDDADAMGTNSTWVITDDQGNILGLPPTVADVEGVNFDDAGAGVCFIWHLRFEDGLAGAEVGMNTSNLEGTFDLSNSIQVTRNKTNAGVLTGGPYEFTIDGTPDMVSGLSLDSSDSSGSNSTYVITDADGNILGMPPTLAAVEGVDFDGAGAGVCLIWYVRYEDGLTGAEVGMNANDLEGCFSLSNSIMVTRTQGANAGVLTGGPYNFCIDGTADMVSGISLDSANVSGENNSWVITDDQGNILGLPPTLAAVEGVDFDGAGAGVCLIWYLRYNGSITGAEVGMNANDLEGDFDLSNALSVTRSKTEAGTLSGGPYNFTIDGTSDFVSGITLDDTNASGSLSTYVITDADGKILGMPPTLAALEGVDFDGAGVGVCLIWYLRYEEGLAGAEIGMNANNLEGCFDLSNAITVNRTMP